MVDFIKSSWGLLLGITGGITSLYLFFEKFIKPRTNRAKLKRLYELISDWYDYAYINLDKGIDFDMLSSKETKIRNYIQDNLRSKWLVFTPRRRYRFLKQCGIKESERSNPRLFEKFSRCPLDKIPVESFWQLTCAAFYDFHRNYPDAISNENILANVSQRIKLLKSYLKIKEK